MDLWMSVVWRIATADTSKRKVLPQNNKCAVHLDVSYVSILYLAALLPQC
jgi:hypothetical protein